MTGAATLARPEPGHSRPLRFAFVMEQNLGHRTHYQNLRRLLPATPDLDPIWVPIPFEAPGVLGRLPLVRSNFSVRGSLMAARAVRALRRAGPLDVVLYHTQVTSLLSPLHTRLPSVISLDATPINYDSVGASYGHASGGPLEPAKRAINALALRRATALITWCEWARRSLVEDYGVDPGRVSVISPGVPLDRWPGTPVVRALRASALPRLLFVGGDFRRKGGEILLRAYRGSLLGRCTLDVVTQQPLAPEPGVTVHRGLAPNSDELLRLYADADVFVLPTLADCMPLVVAEAMAASLPVVATRIGAIPEMVLDGRTGVLVPAGDPVALGRAIAGLLAAPELRRELGEQGRRVAAGEHDARTNALRLLDVLRAAAGRPGGAAGPCAD